MSGLRTLSSWSARRWLTALVAGTGFLVLIAIPTDLIDTPLFAREIPPTWWSWPALAISSILVGLVVATYVAEPGESESSVSQDDDSADAVADDGSTSRRGGWVGGVLTLFAVGCPVCNKVVLLALGSSGALAWFEPIQPLLQLAAIGLLVWALLTRLNKAAVCAVPAGRSRTRTSTPSLTGDLDG